MQDSLALQVVKSLQKLEQKAMCMVEIVEISAHDAFADASGMEFHANFQKGAANPLKCEGPHDVRLVIS